MNPRLIRSGHQNRLAFAPFGRADKLNIPPTSQKTAAVPVKSFGNDFAHPLQLVLQNFVEGVEEADEEHQPEGVILDEIEPVEVWRRHRGLRVEKVETK